MSTIPASSRSMHRSPSESLPSPLTPLIGRERELALAIALLRRDDVRLLTITGPGGVGKTRLAIELGRSGLTSYPDGVVFVPLATVSDAEQVAPAIRRTLGLPDVIGIAGAENLVAVLEDAAMLLVLDNFEHILTAAPLLANLLAACPRLKIVVTSRALLRLTGEFALPVPALALPDRQVNPPRSVLEQSPAIQLFANRAMAIAPSFTLTDTTAPLVADICWRLDGIPLAIELAAAQCSVLSPANISALIAARLPLPVAGPRNAPVRLRSLRDAVAWSYDLLPVDEAALFRRLGIFVGGFTLDAAETIAGLSVPARTPISAQAPLPGAEHRSPLDLIASLVEKSLVQQADSDVESRFAMLETIRAFALEQLEQSNEAAAIGNAHADWCLALAARTEPGVPESEQFRRLEADRANLRAALVWLDLHQDGERLLRLTVDLADFWYAHRHYQDASHWIETALARSPDIPGQTRARAMSEMSRYLTKKGEIQRAEDLLIECIAILRSYGDPVPLAMALIRQGALANHLGAYIRAEDLLEEALGLVGERADLALGAAATVGALADLGIAALGRGELALARARHERALAIARASGFGLGVIRSLRDLGDVARDQGLHAESLTYYRECLSMLGEYGDLLVVVDVLEGSALAAVVWQQPERAAQLQGAAAAFRENFSSEFSVPTDRAAHERTLSAIRLTLSDQDIQTAWSIGRLLTLEEAIETVQSLVPAAVSRHEPADASAIKLSPREKDVLQLLVTGRTDREIAATLHLSVRTIEAHVARILAKVGVRSRTAAATAAIAAGLDLS